MRRALVTIVIVAVAVGVFATAPATAKKQGGTGVIVLNGQGNDLDAYSGTKPFKHQLVIQNHNADPKGRDINAQICFFPDGKTFIAGEDTGQPDPLQGWGIFKLKGTKVGKLKTKQIGKLQPTYQGASDNAENYGCGILSDGRVVTTDIGNQASGPEDGQLIIWSPRSSRGSRRSAATRTAPTATSRSASSTSPSARQAGSPSTTRTASTWGRRAGRPPACCATPDRSRPLTTRPVDVPAPTAPARRWP